MKNDFTNIPGLYKQAVEIHYRLQQIRGHILLQKQKYVCRVEFARQNIKLAFKLRDWLFGLKKS
jgi:hypothetical protein